MKDSTKERLKTIRNLALAGTIVTMITNAGIKMVDGDTLLEL